MAKQDVSIELFYDSQWNDVTSDVYVRDGIKLTQGKNDAYSRANPSKCKLTFNNNDDKYHPRNPNSSLYGKIGRNTPLRTYLGTRHVGASNSDTADTTDHVAPSLTSPTDEALLLCAWAAPQNDTWTLPMGMTDAAKQTSTQSIQAAYEAISATGATGTRTATFDVSEDYVAASVLLHGSGLTVEETEGDSNQALSLAASTQAGWWVVMFTSLWTDTESEIDAPPNNPISEHIQWFELADTGALNPADAQAAYMRMKAWIGRVKLGGAQDISFDWPGTARSCMIVVSGVGEWDVRASGEVSEWLPRRAVKGDVWTEVTASGISRRLGQGSDDPISMPHRVYDSDFGASVHAYWPMEEGSLAPEGVAQGTGSPSPLQGMTTFGLGTLGEFEPLTKLGKGELAPWLPTGVIDPALGGNLSMTQTPDTDGWFVELVYNGSGPASTGTFMLVFVEGNGDGSGGAEQLDWQFTVSTDGAANNTELNVDDGTPQTYLLTGVELPTDLLSDRQPHLLRIGVRQQNTNELRIQVWVDGTEHQDLTFNSETVILDGVARVAVQTSTDEGQLAIGHLVVDTGAASGIDDNVDTVFGNQGETAGDRIGRLAGEQGGLFTLRSIGDLGDTEALGPQYTEPVLTIAREAAAADLGLLTDAPTVLGLQYRTQGSLYNQDAVLTLDWDSGEVAPPLQPATDDRDTRNKITVARRDGQKRTTSDQDSIDAVGRYPRRDTLNIVTDSFLGNQASWRLHLGTVDEDRFPRVTVDLDAAPSLASDVAAVEPGDRIDLTNLPDHLSVDDVSLIVVGWTETIDSHRRKITYNCIPYRPYDVGQYESAQGDETKWDTAGSELNADINDSTTSIDVNVTIPPYWTTDAAELPLDIAVGGERITVTSIAAESGGVQTFGVTRSVNGVTKSHSSGAEVALWPTHRLIYALGGY